MVLSEVVNTLYAVPVGIVVICAILVFVFGFKSAEQPAFGQLTTSYSGDDRKPAGKKRKPKDKKSQSNGHATAVSEKQAEVKNYNSKAAKSEKSPLKEVSNKVVSKQAKKPEASPVKDKSTVKQKDNKKEFDKQLKEKKHSSEMSLTKDMKNVSSNMKGKGKENQLEEIKNKKNEKNLAKLKNLDSKSGDEGGWKQVLSNKDKKNRKKDDLELEDTNQGKVDGTPKIKKAKNIELLVVNAHSHKENKDIEDGKEIEIESKKSEKVKKTNKIEKSQEFEKSVEKTEKKEKSDKKEKPEKKKAEKQNEKKKKIEQESKEEKEISEKMKVDENKLVKPKAVIEVIEENNKSLTELSPDAVTTAKKKSKKKADDKKEVAVDTAEEAVPIKKAEPSDEDSNKKAKSVESGVSDSKPDQPVATAVIDESDDSWKEAKVPKNKKKVRKDQ